MRVTSLIKQILEAALFDEIRDAMKVTFKHMFHKPITFQYPREQRTLPDTHRGHSHSYATTITRNGVSAAISVKPPAHRAVLRSSARKIRSVRCNDSPASFTSTLQNVSFAATVSRLVLLMHWL